MHTKIAHCFARRRRFPRAQWAVQRRGAARWSVHARRAPRAPRLLPTQNTRRRTEGPRRHRSGRCDSGSLRASARARMSSQERRNEVSNVKWEMVESLNDRESEASLHGGEREPNSRY